MEYLDIVDEMGEPTGEIIARNIAHEKGVLHRTAHVWVARQTNSRWEVLLQKRSQEKDSFPGMYDTSSAGHIPAGKQPVDSAIRELEEELGIRAVPEELDYCGSFRIQYEKYFHGSLFKDNEIARVYVLLKPVEIDSLHLQESEVEGVCWFDMQETLDETRRGSDRFCVPLDSLLILQEYLASHTSVAKERRYCP